MRALKLFALTLFRGLTLGKEAILTSSAWVSSIPNHFFATFLNALQRNAFCHFSVTILYHSSHSQSCRCSVLHTQNSAWPEGNFWFLHRKVAPPAGALLFSSLSTFVCCRAGWAWPHAAGKCPGDFLPETDSKLPTASRRLAKVRAHCAVSGGKSHKLRERSGGSDAGCTANNSKEPFKNSSLFFLLC